MAKRAKSKRRASSKGRRRRLAVETFCERAELYCPRRSPLAHLLPSSSMSGVVDGSGPWFMALVAAALLWARTTPPAAAALKPPVKAENDQGQPPLQQSLPGVGGVGP